MIQKETIEMWVARDWDGQIFGFSEKPILLGSTWWDADDTSWLMHFKHYMFPAVTFENSPQPIKLTIKPITPCK